MEPKDLLLDTLADLRRRTDLRASDYDTVQAAGLIRRLLLDQRSVVDTVNKRFRVRSRAKWGRLRINIAARGGPAWVPLLWWDPVLYQLRLDSLHLPAGMSVPGVRPKTGTLKSFLAEGLIVRGDETITTKELVKHYANREGGIHHGHGEPHNNLLADIRAESSQALDLTMLAVARVIYRSLEPLATLAFLADRPHPYGLLSGETKDIQTV